MKRELSWALPYRLLPATMGHEQTVGATFMVENCFQLCQAESGRAVQTVGPSLDGRKWTGRGKDLLAESGAVERERERKTQFWTALGGRDEFTSLQTQTRGQTMSNTFCAQLLSSAIVWRAYKLPRSLHYRNSAAGSGANQSCCRCCFKRNKTKEKKRKDN